MRGAGLVTAAHITANPPFLSHQHRAMWTCAHWHYWRGESLHPSKFLQVLAHPCKASFGFQACHRCKSKVETSPLICLHPPKWLTSFTQASCCLKKLSVLPSPQCQWLHWLFRRCRSKLPHWSCCSLFWGKRMNAPYLVETYSMYNFSTGCSTSCAVAIASMRRNLDRIGLFATYCH